MNKTKDTDYIIIKYGKEEKPYFFIYIYNIKLAKRLINNIKIKHKITYFLVVRKARNKYYKIGYKRYESGNNNTTYYYNFRLITKRQAKENPLFFGG